MSTKNMLLYIACFNVNHILTMQYFLKEGERGGEGKGATREGGRRGGENKKAQNPRSPGMIPVTPSASLTISMTP
jgi:hypothetical protein